MKGCYFCNPEHEDYNENYGIKYDKDIDEFSMTVIEDCYHLEWFFVINCPKCGEKLKEVSE